jgi:predicted murein hydrolase (TIGR00659 family)
MIGDIEHLWVYLRTTPLLWLTLTLGVYQLGEWLFRRLGCRPVFNPVLTAIIVLVLLLKATGTRYETYFNGAQFVHFLLGPATVALAIPLYREIEVIRKSCAVIITTLVAGSVTAIVSAVGIARALGGETLILLTIAPKSATTPIAMGISEKIGGLPSLTAVTVILTGIAGAVLGDMVLNCLKIKDEAARGIAFGLAAHGIGTAHAIMKGRVSGAFAALGMALNGLLTALLLALFAGLMR